MRKIEQHLALGPLHYVFMALLLWFLSAKEVILVAVVTIRQVILEESNFVAEVPSHGSRAIETSRPRL